MGESGRITIDGGKLKRINRVTTKVPPQIRKYYGTVIEAENYAKNITGKSNITDITQKEWIDVANSILDSAPQNRINGKTKTQLTLTDVLSDISITDITGSSLFSSLTNSQAIAKMNEFNSEFGETSADAWNSITKQDITGTDNITMPDTSSTDSLDIISKKISGASITSNTVTTTANHTFSDGDIIKVLNISQIAV